MQSTELLVLEAGTASLLRCRVPRFARQYPAFQSLRCQNHSGTAAVAIGNLISDLLYAALDPRIRL